MSTIEVVRSEWAAFRRPGRLIAMTAAAFLVIGFGLLFAAGNRTDCGGPCPEPVVAHGVGVRDKFSFLHRDLDREGSITVRLTSMSGTITYPPPHHDQIVSGLVPWAKAGIVIKDGVRAGSPYAALMMTGRHGVRFQYDYTHDVAGRTGGLERSPRWLRLTRSGDRITGAESTDGRQWHEVATATLPGLPDSVQAGLFATSPNDLTLRTVNLGATVGQARHTQTVGTFDNVTLDGAATGGWHTTAVGGESRTDWEKYHNPSGAGQKDGVITVSGSGDIGPRNDANITPTLLGLPVGLIIVLIVAARYGASTARRTPPPRTIAGAAAMVGAATFVTAVVAVGVVVPVGAAILAGNGIPVPALPLPTGGRVVVGLAVAVTLCALLTFGLGRWLRRGWAATLTALSLIALPYAIATVPLLPDPVTQWMLRLTPAAGFAVQQTLAKYPQVTEHYTTTNGYFPLPWWAGLAVLTAYTVIMTRVAAGRSPTTATTSPARPGTAISTTSL
jgi:hypothetical protein